MLATCLHLLVCLSMLAPAGPGPKKPARTATPASNASAAEPPVPYKYPAPVKGHFKEGNTGDFDLTDGIAWKSSGGTVVYVTAKPIASPLLAASPCPMTLARSLTALRNTGFLEVTLDSAGKSRYFGSGTPFNGTGREEDVGSHPWSSKLKMAGGRAIGSVDHREEGSFEFDLPVLQPRVEEVSESDQMSGRRSAESNPVPAERAVAAAYRAVREAALHKDLKALLAAQGFDDRQIAGIRGLDGIDGDLAVFADRFLDPGNTGEFQSGPGFASVGAEGRNSKDAKFINYYWFAPCGEKLVLVSVTENPQ